MRKLRLLSLFSLAIVILASSCTKEGPEGPVGATGAQGPAGAPGAPGAPGAGQTTYSTWVTTVSADWVVGWQAPNNYNVEMVYNRTAAGVTQSILDQGVVLAYGRNFTVGASTILSNTMALPYTEAFNGQNYGYILAPGKIVFTYDPDGWAPIRPVSQLVGIAYRYILIPGSLAGRGETPTYGGYTAEELRAMPYEKVTEIFNIPDTGSNMVE